MPHADSIEMLQAAASVVALVLLSWALYDATRDAIIVAKEPHLGDIAIGNVLRSSARVTKAMLFAFAGVACLFLPPPPPETGPTSTALFITQSAIMAATGVILLDAIIERYVRQKFIAGISKQRRVGDRPTTVQENA